MNEEVESSLGMSMSQVDRNMAEFETLLDTVLNNQTLYPEGLNFAVSTMRRLQIHSNQNNNSLFSFYSYADAFMLFFIFSAILMFRAKLSGMTHGSCPLGTAWFLFMFKVSWES